MDNILDEFKDYLKEQVDEGTRNNYVSIIRQFLSKNDINNIADDELIKIINSFIKRDKFYLRRFAFLKLLDFLDKPHLHKRLRKIEQPARRLRRKSLSFNDIRRLVSSAKDDLDRLIIMLQYDTGARISAILNIELGDIDLDNRLVFITEQKVSQNRTVALSNRTSNLLRDYLVKNSITDGKVFRKTYGAIYYRQKKLFREVFSEEGRKISSHWFRSSRAIHLFQRGYSIITVKDFLGHKDMKSTFSYLQESGVESKKLMRKEEPKW